MTDGSSPSQLAAPLTGVSWHKRRHKWRAGFRFRQHDLFLGCYTDPMLAAWVVDVARYLCFGMDKAKWHHKVGHPNFPPHQRHDFPRVAILSKLVAANILSQDELSARLARFDESCAKSI